MTQLRQQGLSFVVLFSGCFLAALVQQASGRNISAPSAAANARITRPIPIPGDPDDPDTWPPGEPDPTNPPAPVPDPIYPGYVALGDSFAAGSGCKANTYDDATTYPKCPRTCSIKTLRYCVQRHECPYGGVCPGGRSCLECRRSDKAYPNLVHDYLLQNKLAGRAFYPTTCFGATVGTLDGSTSSGQNQLKEAADDLNNAKYVTVTIGGNDLGFAKTLNECVLFRFTGASLDFKCANDVLDAIDPNSPNYKLGALKESLKAIYVKIRAAAPNAKILVTGYPAVASNAGGLFLSTAEVNAIAASTDAADKVVREACAESGADVTFVDVYERFRGKGCSGSPEWINCLQIPRTGRSFHPNEDGNRAIADAVIDAINAIASG